MLDISEWLLTNSNGSFAMGSVDRVPRRKYHGLWISRALNNGLPEHLLLDVLDRVTITPNKSISLVHYDFGQGSGSDDPSLIRTFQQLPEPSWTYIFSEIDGKLTRTLHFCPNEGIELHYSWSGKKEIELTLQPLFTVRDAHGLSKENLALDGRIEKDVNGYLFHPYNDLCTFHIELSSPHQTTLEGNWYRNFFYIEEKNRGYPATEDCFCPMNFAVKMTPNSSLTFRIRIINLQPTDSSNQQNNVKNGSTKSKSKGFSNDLSKALNSYVYRDQWDGDSEKIIAGFPWFSSWGRDSFISLPGTSLAWNDAQRGLNMLNAWAPIIEQQFFKGKTKDKKGDLNCTGLDTPFLWAWALKFLIEDHPKKSEVDQNLQLELIKTLEQWLLLFFEGDCKWAEVTDFGLYCRPGSYATSWMDACVQGCPVTPRHGYPIDINTLFFESINLVLNHFKEIKAAPSRLFKTYLEKVLKNFGPNFWVSERKFVGDCHNGFTVDAALRPNQLWALRSPLNFFNKEQATAALDIITAELVTPFGLRTLSPLDSRYRGIYEGDQTTRDYTYHQGTVWPWLVGIYTEACLKHYGAPKTLTILTPLLASLEKHFYNDVCLNQISEIFDADSPHLPRGAPAQAWSVAETRRALWLIKN